MDTVTDLPVILQLSLYGTALALVLAALRRLLKNRLPHALFYYLWLLVLLRLVVPLAAPVPQPVRELPQRLEQSFIPDRPATNLPTADETPAPPAAEPSEPVPVPPTQAPVVPLAARLRSWLTPLWLTGAALHFLWFTLSYLRYTRSLRRDCTPLTEAEESLLTSLRDGQRVTACHSPLAQSPMLVGLLRPCILLPENLQAEPAALTLILRHELIHLSRRDLWYKWLTVAITSFHWFNPLMPWLRREISRCGELSCDEVLLRTLPEGERQAYGRTLLSLAAGSMPAAVPATLLCEEKRQLKERLVSIVKHRKMTIWMMSVSLLLALALAGCAAVLGPGNEPAPFTAPLEETHQEEILAAIRHWGEENVVQHAQAELQFFGQDKLGTGEVTLHLVPHLYDLRTNEIRPVDGLYPDDACLGAVSYTAPRTEELSAEWHLFYLVQTDPATADPVAQLRALAAQYPEAKVLGAFWRQQDDACVFISTRFVTADGALYYTYNGVTGTSSVKEIASPEYGPWSLTMEQLPDVLAPVTAYHNTLESDYLLSWSGDVLSVFPTMDTGDRALAQFLARWKNDMVLDLSTGNLTLLEGPYTGSAKHGWLHTLWPSALAEEYVYLVDAPAS